MTKRKSSNKSSEDNQEMEVEAGSKRKQIMKKRRDINIEEANQLMKKSKNHGDKEAAELMLKKSKNHGDKEVVELINEKSSDDDNDCNDDDDDELVGKTEDHKKPKVFQLKSNLEIVAWLIDHPEILRLALEMNKTDDKIRLWDESVKCLFLRARSPRGEVFDELITKNFKIKIHSNEAKSYLEIVDHQSSISYQQTPYSYCICKNNGPPNSFFDCI
ncbi:hypothetical protein C1646_776819 [Rhizophagus diaphanus]|nr:hypothetical protein C1646_776819 [Rhizophagus diaphanus] [Rhizophagus sp. MUCL 43196]